MTTTIFFVRHAAHDNVGGYLAGRTPGVWLGPAGLQQAERVADRMAAETFAAVWSSPIERTWQTAQAIAARHGLTPVVVPELNEVDFGSWSGHDFDTLNQDENWRRWNAARALNRTPAGESMFDVQVRVLGVVSAARSRYPDGAVVLVSHADVIKAALAYHLGLSLDALSRFEIGPGSVSSLAIDDWSAKVLLLNEIPPDHGPLHETGAA